MDADNSARISPTAYYTSQVWVKRGLSPASFGTWRGKLIHTAFRPWFVAAGPFASGLTMDDALVQRHKMIDHVLRRAIEEHDIRQVVEIASGLSTRAVRFLNEYDDLGLRYIEADLPRMAKTKKNVLARVEFAHEGHDVVPLNILHSSGPLSLRSATEAYLDKGTPTAVISEGLITYLSETQAHTMWKHVQSFLTAFSPSVYITNIYLKEVTDQFMLMRLFERVLGFLTRGDVFVHFESEREVLNAFEDLGFEALTLHSPRGLRDEVDLPKPEAPPLVRILEAWTSSG